MNQKFEIIGIEDMSAEELCGHIEDGIGKQEDIVVRKIQPSLTKTICRICGEIEEGQMIQIPKQGDSIFGMEIFVGHRCLWKIGKSESNLSADELEKQGKGRCDKCGKILPIGRGENFTWHEETSKWLCDECDPDNLIGKKIVGIRQMTKEEVEFEGWHRGTTLMVLDDGSLIYPSQDDEGNGSGAIFGRNKDKSFRVGYQG